MKIVETPGSLTEFLAQVSENRVSENRVPENRVQDGAAAEPARGRGKSILPKSPDANRPVTFAPGSRMKPKCWEGKCDECRFDASECACLHHLMRYDRRGGL
jgi:hypothetical protein